MLNFVSKLLVVLGSVLIGMGFGVIVGWQTEAKDYVYWIVLCVALIVGGFLLAWGATSKEKPPQQSDVFEESQENNQEGDKE